MKNQYVVLPKTQQEREELVKFLEENNYAISSDLRTSHFPIVIEPKNRKAFDVGGGAMAAIGASRGLFITADEFYQAVNE